MVRTPQSLAEAKQIVGEEKAKITRSLDALIGSRILMAVLATFLIAFGINLATSPSQLPNVGGVTIARLGLPPSVDFGVVGEQAAQAGAAAEREGAQGLVAGFLAGHRDWVPILNGIGFGAMLVLLLVNMAVMTRRRPYTKG